MAKIKSKNTKPEVLFRRLLYSRGVRYRINYHLDGKPDIVIVSKKIAIFVDGCFWHKCPKCFRSPNSNKPYWSEKIKRNIARDKRINKILKSKGWKVIRIWEHEIKNNPDSTVKKVTCNLK
jgi:DNA mismatch endonuclease (patch repair protein)